MVYYGFETDDTAERNAIFKWINDNKWVQTATFSDISTLMHRAVVFQHRAALERMLFYGIEPYDRNIGSPSVPLLCQGITRMSVNEMIASYERLREAAYSLTASKLKHRIIRAMHNHKVEMLYCAFETREMNKRDAIINCIDDKKWIQAAKYEGGPTLMQRSDETTYKILEIMTTQYKASAQKLMESQDMSTADIVELAYAMLFFLTSVHDVSLIINFAVKHVQSDTNKQVIMKCLDLPIHRRFVYEDIEKDSYANLISELKKRKFLTKDEKEHYRMEAIKVNVENSEWVNEMKAFIHRIDVHLTFTGSGLQILQEKFNALVVALEVKEKQEAENENIRLAISVTCTSLAFFGGLVVKEMLEAVVFMDNLGIVLDAMTDNSEEVVDEMVVKHRVKHLLAKAAISPDYFVATLQEASVRLGYESAQSSIAKDVHEMDSLHGSSSNMSLDVFEEKETDDTSQESYNNSISDRDYISEKTDVSPDYFEADSEDIKCRDKTNRLTMADVVKMIIKQQNEEKLRRMQSSRDRHDCFVPSSAHAVPTFVDFTKVCRRLLRVHPLHYAVHVSEVDKDKFVEWAESIFLEDFSRHDTMIVRVRKDHSVEEWEDMECSAAMFASCMGYVDIVKWLLFQSVSKVIESAFATRRRAEEAAEILETA